MIAAGTPILCRLPWNTILAELGRRVSLDRESALTHKNRKNP